MTGGFASNKQFALPVLFYACRRKFYPRIYFQIYSTLLPYAFSTGWVATSPCCDLYIDRVPSEYGQEIRSRISSCAISLYMAIPQFRRGRSICESALIVKPGQIEKLIMTIPPCITSRAGIRIRLGLWAGHLIGARVLFLGSTSGWPTTRQSFSELLSKHARVEFGEYNFSRGSSCTLPTTADMAFWRYVLLRCGLRNYCIKTSLLRD